MTGFKKRLASTALATAMTLTALPVSVFLISTDAAAGVRTDLRILKEQDSCLTEARSTMQAQTATT